MTSVKLEIIGGPDYGVDETGWENYTYRVRLHFEERTMETEWHQGMAITDDPEAASVMQSLFSDADTVEYSAEDIFEEWASELGYDPDSRKAEQIYNNVKEQTEKLRALLGDKYDSVREQYAETA